jgi:hypothetical protein
MLSATRWATEHTACQEARGALESAQRKNYRRPTFSLPAGVGFLFPSGGLPSEGI